MLPDFKVSPRGESADPVCGKNHGDLPPEAQVYMLKLLIMNVESQQTHHDKDS
jgi:hypothetical protein